VRDVQAREERIRQDVVEREGLAKGDTRWYLSVQPAAKPTVESPLRIVSAGYAALDAGREVKDESEEEEGEVRGSGRMNFGNFSRKVVVWICCTGLWGNIECWYTLQKQVKNESESSGSEDLSDVDDYDDDEDDPTGAKAMVREQQKAAGDRARADRRQRKADDAANATRLAESRRKKEVNLNRVTSISGSGKPASATASSGMECFKCGKKGHKKTECPQQQRGGKRRTWVHVSGFSLWCLTLERAGWL
jgi:hypothetical protein